MSRIAEALDILDALGMPKAQCNERSALTLLALLDLPDGRKWADAGSPLMGITPIMNWATTHYGKTYAPNTRETFVRRSINLLKRAWRFTTLTTRNGR